MGCDQSIPAVEATAISTVECLKAKKTATGASVAIIYYSTYGHILKVAQEIKRGLEKGGVSVDIFQVPETLPAEVLAKMGAPPKPADIMTLDHAFIERLPEYDGFMFGVPTRFGSACAQMKAFFDSTGGLWQQGKLVGKPAATFVSTGTQNGGQETTHFTTVTNLVHHGMMYVPLGYQAGADQFNMTELHGASPWGSSTLAGADGSRQPSELELRIANLQGEKFAGSVNRAASKPVGRRVKIAVIYYSMYGHLKRMADEVAAAAKEEGAQVDIFQVKESLEDGVLKAMGAPAKCGDAVLEHSNIEKLLDYDGLMFGLPTRFGQPATQIKSLWDGTGKLWSSGGLVGKLAASFVSTGTQNGGQETTHMTHLTQLVHHGMVYVPLGYQGGQDQFSLEEAHGGSPWGASTLAGADGSRQPSPLELRIAALQGKTFASQVKRLAV